VTIAKRLYGNAQIFPAAALPRIARQRQQFVNARHVERGIHGEGVLVSDASALAAYAQKATRAIQEYGGRFLVRGMPMKWYEDGLPQRCVVIEFESVERAISAYESEEYQEAVKLLAGKVERDVRLVESA
jgi:uncharacterized protein (DUF1330 family)